MPWFQRLVAPFACERRKKNPPFSPCLLGCSWSDRAAAASDSQDRSLAAADRLGRYVYELVTSACHPTRSRQPPRQVRLAPAERAAPTGKTPVKLRTVTHLLPAHFESREVRPSPATPLRPERRCADTEAHVIDEQVGPVEPDVARKPEAPHAPHIGYDRQFMCERCLPSPPPAHRAHSLIALRAALMLVLGGLREWSARHQRATLLPLRSALLRLDQPSRRCARSRRSPTSPPRPRPPQAALARRRSALGSPQLVAADRSFAWPPLWEQVVEARLPAQHERPTILRWARPVECLRRRHRELIGEVRASPWDPMGPSQQAPLDRARLQGARRRRGNAGTPPASPELGAAAQPPLTPRPWDPYAIEAALRLS